jgi:hypothetical protein
MKAFRLTILCLAAVCQSGCHFLGAPLVLTATTRNAAMTSALTTALTNLSTSLASNPNVVGALQNVATAQSVSSQSTQEAQMLLSRYETAMNQSPPDVNSANMALMMIATVNGLPQAATLLIGELQNPVIASNAVARTQLLVQVKQALTSSSSSGLSGVLASIGL